MHKFRAKFPGHTISPIVLASLLLHHCFFFSVSETKTPIHQDDISEEISRYQIMPIRRLHYDVNGHALGRDQGEIETPNSIYIEFTGLKRDTNHRATVQGATTETLLSKDYAFTSHTIQRNCEDLTLGLSIHDVITQS